jgi:hypothetical protein
LVAQVGVRPGRYIYTCTVTVCLMPTLPHRKTITMFRYCMH